MTKYEAVQLAENTFPYLENSRRAVTNMFDVHTFRIFAYIALSINSCPAYFTRIIYLFCVEQFICMVRKLKLWRDLLVRSNLSIIETVITFSAPDRYIFIFVEFQLTNRIKYFHL